MNVKNRASLLEAELAGIFQVSRVLSRSLNLHKTLLGVLEVLHETVGMQRGLVTLLDEKSGELLVGATYNNRQQTEEIRYRPGEGIVGTILEEGEVVVIRRLSDEPRFLDRLGVYDPQLAFIGVPIKLGDENKTVGVLSAQPQSADENFLMEYARFLEMVANLVSQSVRLSWTVESERQDLANERDQLRREVRADYGFDNIVGHSAKMRNIFEQVRQVAKWNTTVLIRGESGTGKELIANAIHYNSPRVNGPVIKLNCAALPDNLLESELFGHEKGAFTGAVNKRKGRFEQADGGTLFLDEIGEISGEIGRASGRERV